MRDFNQKSTRRRAGFTTGLILFLSLCLWNTSSLWSATPPPDAQATNLFRMGFSSRIFTGFSENDIIASIKIWGKTAELKRNFNSDPTPNVFHKTDEIVEALRSHKIDAVTMTTEEYWTIRKEVKFARMLSFTHGGIFTEEYVILTRKDSKIESLCDLKGRSLLILDSPVMSMARIWLDTQLLENGFNTATEHCASIGGNTRLTKVVLPVFFRQNDACLVTRRGFETMGELNPQLTQQLRVLASSPALMAAGSFFSADMPPQAINQLIDQLTKIHATSAGQELLTVFQIERIKEPESGQISSTLDLLARHQELCEAARKGCVHKSGSEPDTAEKELKKNEERR